MSELRGSLRNLELVPLVHFLSQQARTGRLKISQAGIEGEIAFNRGRIVSVATGLERGEPALEVIALALADGDFVYADALSDPADPQPVAGSDELAQLLNKAQRKATTVLASVPRVLDSAAERDDAEVELSRGDLAVLMAVDGRRTTAELLRDKGTLRAFRTLTRLSEFGVIQLELPEHDGPSRESVAMNPAIGGVATHSPIDEAAPAPAGQATVAPKNQAVDPPIDWVVVPRVRAGPAPRWRPVQELVQVLALTVIFVLVLRMITQSAHVEGQSMLPGLHEGELLLLDRISYFHIEGSVLANVLPATAQGAMRYPLGGPRRGDVVVFYSPTEPDVELVKRVIGLPNDSVRIENGELFINDTPLDEQYSVPGAAGVQTYPESGGSIHIPDDSYFVLGDNRGVSLDSRQGWLVQASNLVGRAWLVYWPPSAWRFVARAEMVPGATRVSAGEAASAPQSAIVTPATAVATTPALVATPTTVSSIAVERPNVLLSGAISEEPGWPSDPNGQAWLNGSAYHLVANQSTRFVAVAAPLPAMLSNVAVTAAFHKLGGPPGGGYGIIVRDQGPGPRDGVNQGGRYYVAEAGDEGLVGLWRREEDHWVDLVPWTPSPAVYFGGVTNELTLRAEGPRLSFLVNGRLVVDAFDATLPTGRVGVFVGGDLNHVVLDRFTVTIPSAGSMP